jgi:hypothetical protein
VGHHDGDSFPVDRLTLAVDQSLQPRLNGVDQQHVAALLEEAEAWPPLSVVEQQGRFLLVDGFHRLEAAGRLGFSHVQVRSVTPEPGQDLRSLAFQLNAQHGRPLSLSDRRAEAIRQLRRQPERSSRSIGKACGLNHQTVEKLRAGLAASGDIRQTDTRTGDREGGYTYRAPVRKPGELPPQSGAEWVQDKLAGALGTAATANRRRGVSYLRRIAIALEEQFALPTPAATDLAGAVQSQLTADKALALANQLGGGAANLLQVARFLGYRGEGQ